MNRALLVCSLLAEAVLLALEARGLPYGGGVRAAACVALVAAVALAVAPAWSGRGGGLEVIALDDLARPDRVYLGRGGEWGALEAQAYLDTSVLRPGRQQIFLPVDVLDRHVLIEGTTGSGKTRMQELLIAAAILRGDAVVVVDPKGDDRLLRTIRAACRRAGREECFRLVSLPHPDQSVRYSPVSDFGQVREVADRIAALLPAQGEAAAFRAFGWSAVNVVASALAAAGGRVTIPGLKAFAIDRPWDLVAKLVEVHSGGAIHGPDGSKLARTYEKWIRAGRLESLPELDELISFARHPEEHRRKLVAALVPVLSKLAAMPVLNGEGLRWEEVAAGQVVYMALGSLMGGESAAAVAKMALLDLKSYVGRRYAYGKDLASLSLFVDEAADVVTPEFVDLLSKGRGAGVRVCLAAQTTADFLAALGSPARAAQVAGNVGTVIQFCAKGSEDAEAFSALAGERLLSLPSEGQRYEPAMFGSGFTSVDDFRASFSIHETRTRQSLVPPWAVLELPPYSFFARTQGGVLLGRAPLLRACDADSSVLGRDRRGGDGRLVVARPAGA